MSHRPAIPRRLAVPGLGALLLSAACQPVREASLRASGEEGGVGGTGIRRAGLPGPGDEGGIGGTGVFGTVTALGSLRVNGLRIETSAATAVEAPGGRVAPGDTVAVEATLVGPDHLRARRVAVFHPLVGPVQAVEGRRLSVLGTGVLLPPDVPLRDAAGAPVSPVRLEPGVSVAVSGLWRGREVVATSLVLLGAAPPQASVRGLLRRPDLRPWIGGTRIAERDLRAPLPAGVFATVTGTPGPEGGLLARAVRLEPLAVFSGGPEALSVEGFLARDEDGPGVHLAGFGLPIDASGPIPPPTGERRLFLGRYRTSFRVADSLALPTGAAERQAALAAGEPVIRRWLADAAAG